MYELYKILEKPEITDPNKQKNIKLWGQDKINEIKVINYDLFFNCHRVIYSSTFSCFVSPLINPILLQHTE